MFELEEQLLEAKSAAEDQEIALEQIKTRLASVVDEKNDLLSMVQKLVSYVLKPYCIFAMFSVFFTKYQTFLRPLFWYLLNILAIPLIRCVFD